MLDYNLERLIQMLSEAHKKYAPDLRTKEIMNKVEKLVSQRQKKSNNAKINNVLGIWTNDGIFENVIFSKKEQFGYDLRSLEGKNILDLVHPDDIMELKLFKYNIIKHPYKVRHIQFRIRNASGIWVELKGVGLGFKTSNNETKILFDLLDADSFDTFDHFFILTD